MCLVRQFYLQFLHTVTTTLTIIYILIDDRAIKMNFDKRVSLLASPTLFPANGKLIKSDNTRNH